jgi:hypothetical protein
MTTRRGFLAGLLALPVVGRLFGREAVHRFGPCGSWLVPAGTILPEPEELHAPVRTESIAWFQERYPEPGLRNLTDDGALATSVRVKRG